MKERPVTKRYLLMMLFTSNPGRKFNKDELCMFMKSYTIEAINDLIHEVRKSGLPIKQEKNLYFI